MLSRLFAKLSSDVVVEGSGFTWGFVHTISDDYNNVINKPLTTIFWSSISGLLCTVGVSIVNKAIRQPIKPVVPFVLTISCIDHLYTTTKAIKYDKQHVIVKNE